MMDSVTEGWNRRPPLYGPRALLNCTLYPRFTCGPGYKSAKVFHRHRLRTVSVAQRTWCSWR